MKKNRKGHDLTILCFGDFFFFFFYLEYVISLPDRVSDTNKQTNKQTDKLLKTQLSQCVNVN